MSTGFSLKITKKPKKGSKGGKKGHDQKNQSVFGGEQKSSTRTKISLTHVEKFVEERPKELVIKPLTLRSSLWEVPTESEEQQVKYGLTYSESSGGQNLQAESGLPKVQFQSSNLRWLEELPEATNEEEYEQVPVEEFGEALLRGMGWDGSAEETDPKANKKVKLPHEEHRPLYSGIGSKGAGLGRSTGKVSESSFMPLVKVNRETGERVESS